MRITHAVNSETRMVGTERHVFNIAAAQKARGSEVKVVTDRPGWLSDRCAEQGIEVVLAADLAPGSPPFGDSPEWMTRDLASTFKDLRAEVIHCHTPPAAGQAIRLAHSLQIPSVLTIHHPMHRKLLRTARNLGVRISAICVSRINFEELKDKNAQDADFYYVPHGTGTAARELPRSASRGGHPELILVGSLEDVKGIDIALLAMCRLRQQLGRECPRLNIYGGGPEEKFLKEMTTVLELSDVVTFHGFQDGILDRCDRAHVLIMSSRQETGPMVVVEAMSRGIPIVASDVGEVSEMLPDPRYGRVVPAGSVIALAEETEGLLRDIQGGRFDPGLLAERHRSFYTTDKMAERTAEVYQQALRNYSGSASDRLASAARDSA
jgi:glycosyltransferase involved in cell wall biosynthesis